MPTSPAIEVVGVTRRFGALLAVDAVDLDIDEGTLFGFLGRNGAGKTTLIRMLLGLIRPHAGRVRILGQPVDSRGGRSGPWSQVGYLVDGPGLYPELTTGEHLRMAGGYRQVGPRAVEAAVERLALAPYLGVRARALSQGNRQRLGLALALLHQPRVLVLDEPTIGMDPAGVVEIRLMLRDLADSGAAVLMSTHVVGELELIADDIGILHEGRLLDRLDRDRLTRLGQPHLVLTFGDPAAADAAVGALREAGIDVDAGSDARSLSTASAAAVGRPEDLVMRLAAASCPPRGVRVEADTLETHFLTVTGGLR